MDFEIYAICCCQDVNLRNISTASSETVPFLTPALAKALLKNIVEQTKQRTLCQYNQNMLPDLYTTNTLTEMGKFHLFSYHDHTPNSMMKGCYAIIGSENIKNLSFSERCKLSQNILAEGRELADIIKNPNDFIKTFIVTKALVNKHAIQIKPPEQDNSAHASFSGCVLPGCLRSPLW